MSIPADRVRRCVALHFDPEQGSAFWIERARGLGFDPRERIAAMEDLPLLGAVTRDDLLARPLLDFVPRALHGERSALLLAETGGTSGPPLRCVYRDDEFRAGFVEPFLRGARMRGFPLDGAWLYVGPSGPHVIARAARAFARAAGTGEPFSVDFDPRWARAQEPGSLGARLYREHVVAQALDVLARERAEVIFSTPPVLERLADELDEERRARVRGIHVGGMALGPGQRASLQAAFPAAVVFPAYGNSLAGIAPEVVPPGNGGPPTYVVPSGRLRLRVVRVTGPEAPDPDALSAEVPPGERGRVVLDRVDPSFLLVNFLERDEATCVPAPERARELGFAATALLDPQPAEARLRTGGLY